MLKVGRHFRISERAKIIVGRDEVENIFLSQHAGDLIQINCLDVKGPLTLIEGMAGSEEILLAARITARYSDGKAQSTVTVSVQYPENKSEIMNVKPLDAISCQKIRI